MSVTLEQPQHHLDAVSAPQGARRRRSARACDRCHRNACKCSPGIEGRVCSRCRVQGVPCTYNRPAKRRGPQARTERRSVSDSGAARPPPPAEASLPAPNDSLTLSASPPQEEESMTAFRPAESTVDIDPSDGEAILPETVDVLVDIFHHCGFALRPYFHWPTYRSQIEQRQYQFDNGLFLVTMAVCTFAAGKLREGGPIPPTSDSLRQQAGLLFSKCYAAAVRTTKSHSSDAIDTFQMLKAHAILASACLHNGEVHKTVKHLGDYTSLCNISGFYSETDWPCDITEIQRQERRRLFWGVYQQDQYLSSNFGTVSRLREARANVQYPAEVFREEDITESNVHIQPGKVSFLRGFNFCADMYRLLEHIENNFGVSRQSAAPRPGGEVTAYLTRTYAPKQFYSDTLRFVSKLHDDLPDEVKKVKSMTGDPLVDYYGYTATNILITSQTLKMLLLGNETPNVHQRCAIVSELLDEISMVPMDFFRASSSMSLHHLANVGCLLGRFIRYPITAWTYFQVRNVLLVLADFLEKIESGRASSQGLALKLRNEIGLLDKCMQQNPRSALEFGALPVGQNSLSGWPNPLGFDPPNDPKQVQENDFLQQQQGVSGGNQIPSAMNTPDSTGTQRLDHNPQPATTAQRPSLPSSLPSTFPRFTDQFPVGSAFELSQAPDLRLPTFQPLNQPKDQMIPPEDIAGGWPFFLSLPNSNNMDSMFAPLDVASIPAQPGSNGG